MQLYRESALEKECGRNEDFDSNYAGICYCQVFIFCDIVSALVNEIKKSALASTLLSKAHVESEL